MEKESFHFNYTILLLTLVASQSLASTQPRCHEDERSALLEFKATFFNRIPLCCDPFTSDEQARIQSWNASTGETQSNCCSWAGVECDKVSGHVIGLHLSCSCLSGKIDSNTSIFRLLHLRSLNLASNDFNCQIPSAIGNLASLKDLNFSASNFMGHIPHLLGNLTRLVHLDLGYNSLNGTIPSSLGRLSHLNYLDLGSNFLMGEVPSFLGNLVQLEFLCLRDNMLIGQIPPSLGNLTRLAILDLGYNQLVGEIPLSFQNLLKLRFLILGYNQLSGEIPSFLGRLTQLIHVELSFNQFHGTIPSPIFQLQGLRTLDLNSNNLTGTVKLDTFSQAQNLQDLWLSYNKLSLIFETNITNQYSTLALGSCNLNGFPKFLRDQDNLSVLDLSYNNIFGQVPEWFLNVSTKNLRYLNLSGNFLTSFAQDPIIFKWKELVVADFSFNKLQGPVPIPPPQIWTYIISNNRLSGGISPLLCNLSSIMMIDLSNNNLPGFLPQCLSNLSGTLEVMSLQSNNFIGKIPNLNGNSCALFMIDLSYNKLSGPLPRSLQNCDDLEVLNFGNNQIRDVFPSWLGSLRSLKVLLLRHNRFHGIIGEPTNSVEFPMLQIIDLSQNIFSGSLPSGYFKYWTATEVPKRFDDYIRLPFLNYISDSDFYYYMSVIAKGIQMNYSKIQANLTLIDLSSNNFSGAIPKTIGSLKQLKLLNLSNNILTGPLPPFLANLTDLEALDLSQNQLSGEIPQELTQLSWLAVFNVSYNRLTGPIPESQQFATFDNNSYMGNLALCGTPLSRKCRDPEGSPPLSPTSEDQDSGSAMELDWKIVCMGYASGLVIGVVLGNCLITRRRAHRLVKNFGRRKQRR